jgi:hypothetical protein
MRLPFNLEDPKLDERARVKFLYNSPELHQNIEVSLDGDETTVETLLDAFQRFLGALGLSTPSNVVLGFVELNNEDDEEETDSSED